jgi:hypothetical protein
MQGIRQMAQTGAEARMYNTGGGKDEGARTFVASASDCYQSWELPDIPDTFQVYHRTIPGLKTGFDLPIVFPSYGMNAGGRGWCGNYKHLYKGPVAERTSAGYKTVISRFHWCCMEWGHTFPVFTKESVSQFTHTHDCVAEGAGYSFFCEIDTEFEITRKILDVKHTVLMLLVCCAVKRVKWQRAKERWIVKKATGYSWFSMILSRRKWWPMLTHQTGSTHFISVHLSERKWSTSLFTRFDDFKRLTDKEVTDEGSYIKLVFTHSKNDQFGDNSISVIPERPEIPACLVIRLYFRRLGLQFRGSGKLLNFQLRKERDSHSVLTQYSLC